MLEEVSLRSTFLMSECALINTQCAQRFYGITDGLGDEGDEDSAEDIEKSIQKELSKQKSAPKLFKHVHLDIPCVMFFKTRSPINPVDFVQRIIQEVVEKPDIRKMRYINRLTPTTLIGKATEKSLDDLLQRLLPEHFQLAKPEKGIEAIAEPGAEPEIGANAREVNKSKETLKGISGFPSVSVYSQEKLTQSLR